ncbi:MAG TPA: VWA domain-containing protein [Thermoanaerobaculia bacterium]
MNRALLLLLALTLIPAALLAQETKTDTNLAIGVEPLGDSDKGVVVRVTFRYGDREAIAQNLPLVLQGSYMQGGQVLRNFRFAIPEERREGSIGSIQTFAEGELEVDAKLLIPLEEGPPAIVSKNVQKFTIARTGRPYVASAEDGAEAMFAEGVVPESVGAVKIRAPKRDVAPNLFIVEVDVLPPVRRLEFFVEGKKILARNAPPYRAELDLGKLPKRVEVRVVGYDPQGRYVDADAFIVNERETQLEVKITRTETPDGVSHFKLSVQNPKNAELKTVVLYDGNAKKLTEWTRPPYALDIPTARLAGLEFVRASVIDDTGYEAADLLFLNGDRYIEQIDVNLVELPVSVTDRAGLPIPDLKQTSFTVLENGKPQKISGFAFAANLPISVGVLLDHSGSMEQRMKPTKEAAVTFFKSIIKKNDRAFISGFAMDPQRNAPFVTDITSLEAQVNAVPDAGGGTSLYDAIVTGLYRFRNLQGRKALIILTDGEDTTSRLGYDDMLTYARASRVPLYFIGIEMGFMGMGGTSAMKNLAAETGGVVYLVRDVKQLKDTYAQLEKDLRSQYLVSYETESTKKDQNYRTVEVKVDVPDAKVRTIRGFIP